MSDPEAPPPYDLTPDQTWQFEQQVQQQIQQALDAQNRRDYRTFHRDRGETRNEETSCGQKLFAALVLCSAFGFMIYLFNVLSRPDAP